MICLKENRTFGTISESRLNTDLFQLSGTGGINENFTGFRQGKRLHMGPF